MSDSDSDISIGSSIMSDRKLELEREFTRFLRDETFPHKVTVHIGEQKLYCSGAIMVQQSSVFERKIREDNGSLMFDEMIDIGEQEDLVQCVEYLHGANLKLYVKNLEVAMKFSSWYKI